MPRTRDRESKYLVANSLLLLSLVLSLVFIFGLGSSLDVQADEWQSKISLVNGRVLSFPSASSSSEKLSSKQSAGINYQIHSPQLSKEQRKISLALPGEKNATTLVLLSEETIDIPVYDSKGKLSRHQKIALQQISDLNEKTGVIAFAPDQDLDRRQVYGMLVNQSAADPVYWDIAPADNRNDNTHRISKTTTSSMPDLGRCDVGLEPQRLSLPGSEIVPLPRLSETQSEFFDDYSSLTGEFSRLSSTTVARKDGRWREVQLIVVSPVDFTRNRSDQQVIGQIAATVASANVFYEPLLLVVKLVGVQVFRDPSSDPYSSAVAQQDGRAMLDEVTRQWENRPQPEHDAVAVFAKSDFRRLFGLAFPATTCLLPRFSVLFATEGGSSSSSALGLVSTFAHELGHVLGMNHDPTVRSEGPSLMWPFFLLTPNGFSQLSLGEYDIHVAKGGNSCLSQIVDPSGGGSTGGGGGVGITPSGELSFEGGSHQEIRVAEGQKIERQFRIAGSSAQFNFVANNLPPSATVNISNGLLSYQPDFNVANSTGPLKKFTVQVEARNSAARATLSLDIVVANTNRPPSIESSLGELVAVEQGQPLAFSLVATDADLGSVVRVSTVNSAAIRRFPGRPFVSVSGNAATVNWIPPISASGIFEFVFLASDSDGASIQKIVRVKVIPFNAAPILEAPGSVLGQVGKLLEIIIRAQDPEGARVVFDFTGLPAGSVYRVEPGIVRVYYLATELGKEESFVFNVSATDGVKTARKAISVSLSEAQSIASGEKLPWPGEASVSVLSKASSKDYSGDGLDDLTVYYPSSGQWIHLNCLGEQTASAQFGGFLGDLPISFQRDGRARRAIYRTLGEQGVWFVDSDQGTESFAWGLKGDIPVSGDFDGDRQSDYMVFRPSTNQWLVSFSSIPSQTLNDTALGADSSPVYIPNSADVDGDLLSDRILFSRKVDGSAVFHAWLASGEQWGFVVATPGVSSGSNPLSGDFDGDGRSDFAVQTSIGQFRSLLSETGEPLSANGFAVANPLTAVNCQPGSGGNSTRSNQVVSSFSPQLQSFSLRDLSKAESTSSVVNFEVLNAVTLESAANSRARRFTASTINDSNRDGRSDIAVFRENKVQSIGQWFEQNSLASGRSYQSLTINPGDVFAQDFTGHRHSTLGHFSDGRWLTQTEFNFLSTVSWGVVGDLPVAADYNGDGLAEVAVFRPGDASWWILFRGNSSAGIPDSARMQHWGEQGDIPVPADYNGDGTAELAVWRPRTGQWFILFGDGTVTVEQFGLDGDIPVPGDFTGSGRAQFALWRPSIGQWFIKDGAGLMVTVVSRQWGIGSDTPVAGDFDGDGRQELVVWRPGDGNWYIQKLDSVTLELRIIQFGLFGDSPLGGKSRNLLL